MVKILLLLLLLPLVALSAEHHVVFDVDQTLAYKIHGDVGGPGDPLHGRAGRVLEVNYLKPEILPDGTPALNPDGSRKMTAMAEKYRLYDGVAEFLEKLRSEHDVKVSFFSGASSARTTALLAALKMADGSSALDHAYRVKGEADLVRVRETGRYREMFRKDLGKISEDLENVIMVDDIEFVLDSQRRNLLHIGEEFPYQERKLNVAITEELLEREAGRFKLAAARVMQVLEKARSGGSLVSVLDCSRGFAGIKKD